MSLPRPKRDVSDDTMDEDTTRSQRISITSTSYSAGTQSTQNNTSGSGTADDMDADWGGGRGEDSVYSVDDGGRESFAEHRDNPANSDREGSRGRTPPPGAPTSSASKGGHRSSLNWGVAHMLDVRLASYMVPGAASPEVRFSLCDTIGSCVSKPSTMYTVDLL